MSERDDLCISIANTIKTYRQGEIPEPTPAHVSRWAEQFTAQDQVPFLREFNHVIGQTFLTKETVKAFLTDLIRNPQLAGANPPAFWSSANVLQVQKKGQSQKEMVKIFGEALEQQYGLKLTACGQPGIYIYLDDVLFTGGRVATDLQAWIASKAPAEAIVHVILIALHTSGSYYIRERRLKNAIEESGKKIELRFWRLISLENRLYYRNVSHVLWPTSIPDDPLVQAYTVTVDHKLRQPGGPLQFFTSEAGRQLLEREFLIAGAKIRSLTPDLNDFFRPLGCSNFGLGFGSMIATYRNCPNNCPLAMWWGDGTANAGALHWYPLLPRKTYAAPENIFNDFDDLTI